MQFRYKAQDRTNKIFTGLLEAANEDGVVAALQQRQLTVISVEPIHESIFSADIFRAFTGPSHKDIVVFTRQLATLIDADVAILEALHILAHQTQNSSFRKILNGIALSVESGASLSTALADYDFVFDKLYVNLVKLGEISGRLQQSLLYLAEYLERSAALASKIKGALFYPTFVLIAMFAVGILMMTTVVPKLLEIIKDSGVTDLPFSTRMLISVSDFMSSYIILLIVLILGGVIAVYYYWRTVSGHRFFDNLKIHIPRFGSIIRNLYLARISETLSTLIKSGVPILEGLTITADIVGNDVYREILLTAKANVQNGGTISETFQKYSEFPPLVSSMLETGEKTGRSDYMFENVFKFYKTEAEDSINNLSSLLEPVIILVLGVGVGFLVAAILLPIYSLIGA